MIIDAAELPNASRQAAIAASKACGKKIIDMNKDEQYKKKFLDFAVRMVRLKNYLNEQKHEYNIADQIQRSGTSIGANHREAINAESEIDFVHKLSIAQKECNETMYWLEVLKETEYITEEEFNSLYEDANQLMRMLSSSIVRVKVRAKAQH